MAKEFWVLNFFRLVRCLPDFRIWVSVITANLASGYSMPALKPPGETIQTPAGPTAPGVAEKTALTPLRCKYSVRIWPRRSSVANMEMA